MDDLTHESLPPSVCWAEVLHCSNHEPKSYSPNYMPASSEYRQGGFLRFCLVPSSEAAISLKTEMELNGGLKVVLRSFFSNVFILYG
ncbi:hypothetical protein AVEN_232426-1 [Araneus ventricosus]|uniref:Uncharacterized protein n=1 Tax=Araneus ventricosus TaxID=182803 RepID=A0A4Y2SRW3_ARAVE|nr:hypothetical protein AVEN_232426-1 [Araneus ventricosus]